MKNDMFPAVDIALPEFQRAIYKVICIKENLK